ncbi:MAG: 4-hydroxybenzoate octaprenyltransferase [Actinobacteria bacterium]|nr:MAG: 4-hydroxybenzoate octaprenyltransferase [Actinomycetota bacterium]
MIKFEHTIFALPFAYMGAVLGARIWPSAAQLFWITLAMAGARSLAFALNRWIDREIDARNPRTATRALPRGLLSSADMLVFSVAAFAAFLVAVYNLAPVTRLLWPIALAPLVVYPYTKRFTWACHFVLGASLGLAPIAAWVAVTGEVPLVGWLLVAAVAAWVAGFDVIYATQDVDVDREQELHSIPARFGIGAALLLTALLHGLAVILLVVFGLLIGAGPVYYLGVLAAAALLWYENSLVTPEDLSRLNVAFFTMNGVISVVVFLFTLADKALRLRG